MKKRMDFPKRLGHGDMRPKSRSKSTFEILVSCPEKGFHWMNFFFYFNLLFYFTF